jgi:putative restriction endonuclease
MRKRIAFYRKEPDDPRKDYLIGCRVLTQPFFFPEQQWIPIPGSWSPNIVQGRTYDTSDSEGRRLWEAVLERESQLPAAPIATPRYGEPTLIRPRLGQGAFRVIVTDVYQRQCAVTGERTLPILDAAHIRPFGDGGKHEISKLRDDFENGRHYYTMKGHTLLMPPNPDQRPGREFLECTKQIDS